jgi:hypothetical protein
MSEGREYNKAQERIINRYYEHRDTIMLDKLAEIVGEIYLCTDPKKKNTLWKSAYAALQKTGANAVRVQNVIAMRKVEELAKLVNELTLGAGPAPAGKADPTVAPAASTSATPAAPAAEPISPETLKSAIRAFKKRLKLTRLDDESKITVRPMTSGGKSEVQSILPPDSYPRAVWDELVKQGRLRYAGNGFFEYLGEMGGD